MSALYLRPARGASGAVRLPGSKSISNRVLLLATLAQGATDVQGLLDADDTRVMRDALAQLGGHFSGARVDGVGGIFPVKRADLFLGNAGTAFRPLTAVLAVSGGEYRLSGVPRMHERPIGDLVDALRGIGARIEYDGAAGFPPLAIHPGQIALHGPVVVSGAMSSQFLTALLLALPLVETSSPGTGAAARVEVDGELISKPYVDVTINVMRRFGVAVERSGWTSFAIPPGPYRSPGRIFVEGDASAASYFLAAGAIGGGPVRVEGVGRDSIQGDVRFAEVLEAMGARVTLGDDWIECVSGGPLAAFDLDLNHIPDAAMTAAVLALFADGPSTIRNIASWRVKETDRLKAMATELGKLGAVVEEGADSLRIVPPPQLQPDVSIDTYDDHRMAMSFALAALGGVGVRINDPQCVAKTFPRYFEALESILLREPPAMHRSAAPSGEEPCPDLWRIHAGRCRIRGAGRLRRHRARRVCRPRSTSCCAGPLAFARFRGTADRPRRCARSAQPRQRSGRVSLQLRKLSGRRRHAGGGPCALGESAGCAAPRPRSGRADGGAAAARFRRPGGPAACARARCRRLDDQAAPIRRGQRVRRWTGKRLPRAAYLQEYLEGTPGSVVFVAAGGQVVPLGVSRQLVGDAAFGARGCRYCGSIMAGGDDVQFSGGQALMDGASALARAAGEAFGLIGVNGVDFIARSGTPSPIEVNPRWSASMELVEQRFRLSVFRAHADACVTGALPTFDFTAASRDAGATGKAIVFARHAAVIGDTQKWLGDATVRDVPRPGERVAAGQPVCTVFATAPDARRCYEALVQRSARVYEELAAWTAAAPNYSRMTILPR